MSRLGRHIFAQNFKERTGSYKHGESKTEKKKKLKRNAFRISFSRHEVYWIIK
jgi:hypothetical protein